MDSKRNILLIGVVAMLLAVLGATYAYFQVTVNNNTTSATVTGKLPPKSVATLKDGIGNLYINISASDMSKENVNNEYYATDDKAKSYEKTEEEGTKTIAEVELTGGEETTRYSCTAKITVSKAEEDEMIDLLNKGDMILQFKGNVISEQLDLSELKENNPKEYNVSFNVNGNTPEEIQAYIKLINKNENQGYIAGKNLNVNISTSDLSCDVYSEPQIVKQLRKDDTNKTLSEGQVGDMYRYQGVASDVNSNYLCFGTDDTSECTSNEDEYMYRIIGVLPDGQIKVIKNTRIKASSNTTFTWNHQYGSGLTSSTQYNCPDGICPEWPDSLLFKRLNGLSNGTTNGSGSATSSGSISGDTDIFIDNSNYDYMNNEAWTNKIENHKWLYGDIYSNSTTTVNGTKTYGINNDGLTVYQVENGELPAYHYGLQPDGSWKQKVTYWAETGEAKVGLMNLSDYYLAYDSEINCGTSTNSATCKTGWLHISNNGDSATTSSSEWTIARYGRTSTSPSASFNAYVVTSGGYAYISSLSSSNSVRPVFYLNSGIEINSGTGKSTDPYILKI